MRTACRSLFGLPSFTGSLEITSTKPIVSLSINFEAAPVFSSLPPGDLDASPDIPGEMLAPTDEAAFNDLFVGKRMVPDDDPDSYVDFVSPGRFQWRFWFSLGQLYLSEHGSEYGNVNAFHRNAIRHRSPAIARLCLVIGLHLDNHRDRDLDPIGLMRRRRSRRRSR